MSNSSERVKALEKHMDFLLGIPMDKLEAHSNECSKYHGLSELELEESYRARELSFNLLDNEKGDEDFRMKNFALKVDCMMSEKDKDEYVANATLFDRKDKCVYDGKLIFIPLTSVFRNDLGTIRNWYNNHSDRITNVNDREKFIKWLDESLENSCKIEIKYDSQKVNDYVNKHFNVNNKTNKQVSSLSTDKCDSITMEYESYSHKPTMLDAGTSSELQKASAPVATLEKPKVDHMFADVPTIDVIKEKPELISPEQPEVEVKPEPDLDKLKSKRFKEECIVVIRDIVKAYENNKFRDKNNQTLKQIAMQFIKDTKDLALCGDDWVSGNMTPEIEKILDSIVVSYRELVCCRNSDSPHGCTVCPSPHKLDIKKDPLRYIKRSLDYMCKR